MSGIRGDLGNTSVPALAVEAVSKSFGSSHALRDINLTVPAGSLTVLLGPAGAGKTTALRVVAGLERPDAGSVAMRGQDVGALQPKDRDVSMIFDNLALYPNRTGFENIASPLLIRRVDRATIERDVRAMAATLKISHVLHRLPKTMSGGERQRVALGRALVRKPGLSLLDEPLSSLDAMLRIELRAELKRLQREHGHSFLMATPDFAEALALADTVVVLRAGRVVQTAGPQTLYDSPADRFVARFVGAPEINIAAVTRLPGAGDAVEIAGGRVVLPLALVPVMAAAGARVEAGIRPEHLTLADPGASAIRGTLTDIEPLGIKTAITLRNDRAELRVLTDSTLARRLKIGEAIGVDVRASHLVLFDAATGRRLPPSTAVAP